MAFAGISEEDVATIRRTAPVVLRHETAFTTALYEHFLRFPASARFFLGEDGQPDTARLERRKHSLGRWLRETAEVATTREFSCSLLASGLAHSHRAHGPGGRMLAPSSVLCRRRHAALPLAVPPLSCDM